MQLPNILLLIVQVAQNRAVGTRSRLTNNRQLLGNIRHNTLTRIGGGRGANIRDGIQNRAVCLMPNCRNDRSLRRRHGTYQSLIREREQILKRTAAAGDHNHINLRMRIQLAQRRHDLARRAFALDLHVPYLKLHSGPAQRSIANHVFFGIGITPGNQSHTMRQQRERLLASIRKQPFGGQLFTQYLQLFVQVTRAHRIDTPPNQREPTVLPQAGLR